MSGSRLKATGRGGPRAPQAARATAVAARGDVVGQFAQTLALHQAGRLAEAEALYRKILEVEPGHVDARHHLGIVHYQRGEHIAAIRQIDAALKVDRNLAAAHNNRGAALAALGRLDEAAESYARAIALKPDYVDALLNRGNALKDLGRHDAALASYDRVVALAPNHAVALAKRGNVLQALRRPDEAVTSYDRAIALRPDYAEACNNRGVAFAGLGHYAEAVASFAQALTLRPDDGEALANRAEALAKLGRFEDAITDYDRAIARDPADPGLLAGRGNALSELGRFADAITSYDRAITLVPDFVDAWCNRGSALSRLAMFDAALASYDRALALALDHAEAHNNRGNALYRLQRLDEALASYDRALALKPGYADAFNNRSNVLRELRRLDEALASCDQAIALRPDHPEYHNNRAVVLYDMRRLDGAVASYNRAIALDPGYAEAHSNRGFALRDLRKYAESADSFGRAVALAPDFDFLRGTHLHAKMCICDWTDFASDCAQLLAAVDEGRAAAPPFQLLAIPASPAQQLRAARRFAADKCGEATEPLWRGERYAHPRIRVAYLSADLRDHPITALTAGLFERHDRSRFETIAISFKSDADNLVREQLAASFDRFIDARRMSDPKVAGLARELEVDIAVDLNGHTEGARPGIFARRPAPVQIGYLGYAGTLGMAAWDYIIADRFVVPDADRAHYAEKVVDLPDCFMVTDRGRRISQRTPSRAEAGLPERGFVFCCFNNSFKITPDIFDVWMRLLGGIAGSVLWLSGTNASAVANLRREAKRRGVAAERLVFAARVPLNEDHLARLRLADLFIDTPYYNAHTTAVDALWAGVPVLTCPGATFASRVAGSLLGAIGLPELRAGSLAEYEALASGLAHDPAHLAALRQKLAHNRDVHPLFDTDRFTRRIEAAYITMWERAQRGEPPCSFAISSDGGTAA